MRFEKQFIFDNKIFLLCCLVLVLCFPNDLVIKYLRLNLDVGARDLFAQPWRLMTGHIVHSGWTHLFLNLLNFFLLRLVFYEWLSDRVFLSVIIVCALVISMGMWLTSELSFYVGFSGVIHGLLVYLLLEHRIKHPVLFSLVLLFVLGKIVYEQVYGASPTLTDVIGVSVAVDAHAFGVLAAFCCFIIKLASNFLGKNSQK